MVQDLPQPGTGTADSGFDRALPDAFELGDLFVGEIVDLGQNEDPSQVSGQPVESRIQLAKRFLPNRFMMP